MHFGFRIFLIAATFLMAGCKFQPDIGYNTGFSPDQPIAFDHSLHVQQNQIQCQYCHNQVERTTHASVPALSTCMNCHLVIRNKPGTKDESPEIKKLVEAYNAGQSVPWVKVHMLPDHVKFNHSAHIQKGVNCQTCHGPVETMQKVKQVTDLSMGWCVNCHREPQHNAPTNCSTCHH